MSNREDYLDSLLRTVTDGGEGYSPEILETEDDFLEKFDRDVADLDDTSFLNDFEMELDDIDFKDDLDSFSLSDDLNELDFYDNQLKDELDQNEENLDDLIVDTMSDDEAFSDLSMNPSMEEELDAEDADRKLDELDQMLKAAIDTSTTESEDEMNINTMSNEDFASLDYVDPMNVDFNNMESQTSVSGDNDDKDILDILSDMSDNEDLADIGNMLKAHDNNEEISIGEEEVMDDLDNIVDKEDMDAETGEDKKKPKKVKNFLKRVSLLLFGADDDVNVPESDEMKNISDENMEVLQDLEKEKKKKEKKEKQELKKKENEEKRALKAKANQEKRAERQRIKQEKIANEPPDNTPPLPRVPVILIFLMCISIICLVVICSNLVGYSTSLNQGESKMSQGSYVEAFEAFSGMKLKESDMELYDKARLAAYIQKEMQSYEVFMEQKMYPEALDSLINGLGNYNKNYEEAVSVGIDEECDRMYKKIKKQLDDEFGINEEEALSLYNQVSRETYTRQINDKLKKLGLI